LSDTPPPAGVALAVYLSASTARLIELRGYARDLTAEGFKVVSSWLWAAGRPAGDAALRDLEDLRGADALLAVTSPRGASLQGRGGRHVELGVAIERGLAVVVLGESEHIFHGLPGLYAARDWPSALALLRSLRDGPSLR